MDLSLIQIFVLNIRMALDALDGVAVFILGEALRAQGHALIELYIVADDAGFANDHALSLIHI